MTTDMVDRVADVGIGILTVLLHQDCQAAYIAASAAIDEGPVFSADVMHFLGRFGALLYEETFEDQGLGGPLDVWEQHILAWQQGRAR